MTNRRTTIYCVNVTYCRRRLRLGAWSLRLDD